MLQLSQRPLTGSDTDRKLFVNRTKELEYLRRAAQLGFNVLLLGERGIGLTSLVHQHHRTLENEGYTAYYVSSARLDSLTELLETVRLDVFGPSVSHTFATPVLSMQQALTGDNREPSSLSLLKNLSAEKFSPGQGRPVIILDEMHKPELVHQLFGRCRDEVWGLPFRWIVCGMVSRHSQYVEPPADAFFDSVLTVGPLDVASSRDLLQARLAAVAVDDAESTARIRSDSDRIVEQGEGNPRRLLAAARDTLLYGSEEAVAADRLLAGAAELGVTARLALRHILNHGPTSASDEDLLNRLDVTRARVTQVLRRLEDAGLVYGFPDKRGVGRPRKLYTTHLRHEITA